MLIYRKERKMKLIKLEIISLFNTLTNQVFRNSDNHPVIIFLMQKKHKQSTNTHSVIKIEIKNK